MPGTESTILHPSRFPSGFVPDTKSPDSEKEARRLWHDAYPEEPFDLNLKAANESNEDSDRQKSEATRLTYDIRGAMGRQRSFYYNVSLPHYQDDQFLQTSLLRYKKFLRLHQLCPQEFLVPCYDIDLMWHTHQLEPVTYERDCLRLLGRVLSHDDNVGGDRSEGSKLSKAFTRTAELWKQHFGEPYARSG